MISTGQLAQILMDTIYTYTRMAPILTLSIYPTTLFAYLDLKEGDFASARVYTYVGDNISNAYTSLAKQTVPVFNFHVSGKTFEFNQLSLNNQSLNFSETISGYHATGKYSNNQSLLSFSVINPRNDATLSYFGEDPFFSGARYTAKKDAVELESFDLSSFTLAQETLMILEITRRK